MASECLVPNTEAERRSETKGAKDKLDKAMVRWTRVLAFFTGALVFTAVLQFWAMYRQLNEMTAARVSGDQSSAEQMAVLKAQAIAMQEEVKTMEAASAQNERAISATVKLAQEEAISARATGRIADASILANASNKKLADAAMEANKINQNGIFGSQRAFVLAKNFHIETSEAYRNSVLEGHAGNAEIDLENTGNTATVEMAVHVKCFDGNTMFDIDPLTYKPTLMYQLGIGADREILGAKSNRKFHICTLFHGSTRNPVVSRPSTTVVYGRIDYRDVFDPKSVHVTEFCYNVTFIDGPSEGGGRATFSGASTWNVECPNHNCADNECSGATLDLATQEMAKPASGTDDKLPK